MAGVFYKFDKQYFIKDGDRELIVVHADTDHGRLFFSHDQSMGKKRDYMNQGNELAELDKYVAEGLRQISFKSDETVESANKKIDELLDPKNVYEKFDREIISDVNREEDFWRTVRGSETYYEILTGLSKLEPNGVHAIINGTSYPFSAALHDFASGVSRKEIVGQIEKLPKSLRERLTEFAKKHNYILSAQLGYEEYRAYKDSLFKGYRSYDRSAERIENVISRAADDVLRDALQYKYYQTTGNADIFLAASGQKMADRLSDQDVVSVFGWRWMQNYSEALQVLRRMDQIMSSGRDVTPFITELNKTLGATYYNQNIIRMTFDTLRPHYNKFQRNKAVTEMISRMAGYVKDARLWKHISETFGLEKQPKINKPNVKASLKAAAQRIESGDAVSDLVVLERKNQIARDYAMIPTDETFGKVKASYKPTKTQQKIAERFGTREK